MQKHITHTGTECSMQKHTGTYISYHSNHHFEDDEVISNTSTKVHNLEKTHQLMLSCRQLYIERTFDSHALLV